MLCYRGEGPGEGDSDLPVASVFSNAKVTYFWIMYPEPHHSLDFQMSNFLLSNELLYIFSYLFSFLSRRVVLDT